MSHDDFDETVCPAGVYDYRLAIRIPDVPYRDTGLTMPLTRHADGQVTVPGQPPMTAAEIRAYLVNDLAKDHHGKTVTVTEFALTRAAVAR